MQLTTFTSQEMEKIHEASLQILNQTGIIFHSKKVLNMFRHQGARVENDKVFIQMINPGNPMIYTCASTAAYMKDVSFVTGTPELSLIHSGGIQMGKEYYNLPTRSLCGMSDAKTIDCQAGFESMASALTSILSGTDMIAEAMGCLESFMATSYEKFIIDEEIIERALCIKKGLDARLRAYMEKN